MDSEIKAALEKKVEEPYHWIAIYTKPRAEKMVAQRINEIEKFKLESYLPLQRRLHKWSDRKKWVEVPLFTSYVFVHAQPKAYYWASHVDGAVMSIKFGGREAIIPDEEIEYIKTLVANEIEASVQNTSQLKLGARARIISGSLEGSVGEIVSDCKDGNFAVSVTGMSVSIVINVSQDMLEVLPQEKKEKGLFSKNNF